MKKQKKEISSTESFSWGRFLASMETAGKALAIAVNYSGLISKEDHKALMALQESCCDLEFKAWTTVNTIKQKSNKL